MKTFRKLMRVFALAVILLALYWGLMGDISVGIAVAAFLMCLPSLNA